MLEVEDLNVHYEKAHTLKDVSLSVGEKEIVALIGNNGAGKSTLLRALSGVVRPSSGRINFNGQDLGGLSCEAIVRQGVIQVPEGRRVFPGLTVQENLRLGAYTLDPSDLTGQFERALSTFPILKERANQQAGTLSGGEQQMLSLARALMAKPKLLLLDEPSLGLAPFLIERIYETITEIHQQGTPVLLVEQNAYLALRTSRRAYVMETGRIVMSGAAADLLHDEHVRKSYLGM